MLFPFVREVTHSNLSSLATEATREQTDMSDWQIKEILSAIAEADAGDFATDTEVKATMDKWDTYTD